MSKLGKAAADLQKTITKLQEKIAEYSSTDESYDRNQSWKYNLSIDPAMTFAGGYISRIFCDAGADFEWNRFVYIPSSFDDLNFRYKNKVFSVIIKIYYNGEEIPIDFARQQKMLTIAKQNNLIPCVFPVNITDNMEEYKICRAGNDDINLFDLETGKPINPVKLASNQLVRRSKYELLNGAIKMISDDLEENGFKTGEFYDDPTLSVDSPRLWFFDDNNMPCWVVVKVVKDKKFRKINVDKIINNDEYLRHTKGYIALLMYESKGKPIYRGIDVDVSTLENIILRIHNVD